MRVIDGQPEIREKDADQIQAILTAHGPGVQVFRAADTSLFYVRSTGETRARKITIESEQGDSVIIWRNLPE